VSLKPSFPSGVGLRPALFFFFAFLTHAQDPGELIRRAIDHETANAPIARNYTFLQRQVEREIDSHGKIKKTESDTHDITLLEGSPYARHVAHNDQPLPPKETAKEEEKLRKSIEDRRKESPEHRAQRRRDWERKHEKQREPLKEIPAAFDLKLAGSENVNGVDTWRIDATPHAGYKPRMASASFFPKVKARFWIAKSDDHCVRVEMESLDTITFGGILIRMAKGSHFEYDSVRVNNEVWLPKRVILKGAMRVALVKMLRGDVTFEFSDYKKFQTDSRIVQ
jgi:hypothetical protein